ncbi:uncharacterized protein LOC120138882 [Hibiscus syriacus]|uniref:uncharacterized protein LOC120138882 n=1 Tax=Hibiscus syriacus TaxID=106335 RepID=UPI001922F89E|nr:uncharacterized protein LOC120138882 [Hibiscus syriacus]
MFAGLDRSLSTRSIWEALRTRAPKVPWQHIVWFPGRILKHSVIAWMAILDRSPTRVRLQRMGLNIENVDCLLCGMEAECRDHLFFGCIFAKGLWGAILGLCDVYRGVSCWDGELVWAIRCLKGKSFIVGVLRLAWTSHIYGIWKERNNRLYGGRAQSVDDVLQDIKEALRVRMEGKAININDPRNAILCANWGIS